MAEYIDIDAHVVVTDTRNREHETTVRHIFEMNKGVYTAADVRPVVQGKWLEEDSASNRWAFRCSFCDCGPVGRKFNFCPNCGADMRE